MLSLLASASSKNDLIGTNSELRNDVTWAKNEGIHGHPDWYPGLSPDSSFLVKLRWLAWLVPCLWDLPCWHRGAYGPCVTCDLVEVLRRSFQLPLSLVPCVVIVLVG